MKIVAPCSFRLAYVFWCAVLLPASASVPVLVVLLVPMLALVLILAAFPVAVLVSV